MQVKLAAVIRRKVLAVLLAAPLAVAAAGMLAGCPAAATTTAYTPITGIDIRSASLVAGFGCGTGDGQVFRYAAFLKYVDGDAVRAGPAAYSGVFDCYSDGIFSNLPTDDAGSLSFFVRIIAWNQASFPAALSCDPDDVPDTGFTICPGDTPDAALSEEGTPNWTTTCTATQQSGVSVLAVCAPLATPDGGSDAGSDDASADAPAAGDAIVVDTHGFVAADGGTLVCGADYQTVRATYSGAQSGIVSAECPAPLSIAPPTVAGGAYSLTVELLQSGTAVAQTVCQATASATAPTTASCAPATGP